MRAASPMNFMSALSTAKPQSASRQAPHAPGSGRYRLRSFPPFAGYVQDDTLRPDGLGYVLRKGGVRQH